ncbi:hypothetical protein AOQ84DRAFT_408110 [Glonium stellatum]|uniref:Uncharacterized protein n=1 Tax=Glonium stellatum TaxID=574774 RepID=A0A8E2EZM1_9PEZI|nr:hypothetical protein AOQ84DRAFT_408110 [Glonium stellatum]
MSAPSLEVRDEGIPSNVARFNQPFVSLVDEARTATKKEYQMSLWEGIRLYPKAIAYALPGSFYAFLAFQKKYSQLLTDRTYGFSAPWQAGLSGAITVGQIMELLLTGHVSERFGYKRTILAALAAIIAFIPILFFAQNIQTLVAGEFLIGIPLSAFQMLAVTYASEVCPLVLRCSLAITVNLAQVIRQLTASCISRGQIHNTSQWSYRIPFTIDPWWLVRQGRVADAINSLRRLTIVSMMVHTNELEKEMAGITRLTWAMQNLCGTGLMAYSTYFYLQARLHTSAPFNLSAAQYSHWFSWNLVFDGPHDILWTTRHIHPWPIHPCHHPVCDRLSRASRRTFHHSWAIGSMLLVYVFVYNCTIGLVVFTLAPELPATRLRSKINWKGKAGFFWDASCLLCALWSSFALPETKGRTYAELDVLFEQKASGRNFKTAIADPFNRVPEASPPRKI